MSNYLTLIQHDGDKKNKARALKLITHPDELKRFYPRTSALIGG